MGMDERIYTIGLNLIPGIGAVRYAILVSCFGSAKAAWEASPTSLRELNFPKKTFDAFLEVRASTDLEAFLAEMDRKGITILTQKDEGYPRRLKSIDHPPPVLYMLGEVTAKDE